MRYINDHKVTASQDLAMLIVQTSHLVKARELSNRIDRRTK